MQIFGKSIQNGLQLVLAMILLKKYINLQFAKMSFGKTAKNIRYTEPD